MRRLLASSLVIAAFVALPAGAAGAGPAPRIAAGVSVGGVPVGGLTIKDAEVRLTKRLARPARRPIAVRVAGLRATFAPLELGVRLDTSLYARRAYYAGGGASGQPVDVPVRLRADRRRVLAAVGRLGDQVRRRPRSPRLLIGLRRVAIVRGRTGRALRDPAELARRLRARLADPLSSRRMTWRTRVVRPMGPGRFARREGSVVTVQRSRKLARLFVPRRGRYRRAAAYRVAVGRPGSQTPRGRFAVQAKSINPSWSAPTWAGPLAGQTIPGGDPRNPIKARWIGFNGGVGFHGTADLGSLGSEASRGCVRMSIPAVKQLYRNVRIGTPVLVR
ncbi:MAG: L,D-transpeptidase [Solirubrobacteraceae bacterium]